jgi:MFS family permease
MNRREVTRLLVLFGTLYFVQGIVETTTCLPAQPIQSHLSRQGFTAGQVGHFFAIIGIAWSLKPLFGLISDFFPIAGRRRQPYLIFSTGAAAISFLAVAAVLDRESGVLGGQLDAAFRWLAHMTAGQPQVSQAGWLLVIAGVAVALTDVVVDALAVERGQPLGITGQIQAVQWGALSVAGLIAGSVGGYVAQHQLSRPMFVGCGLLALASLAAVLILVREPRRAASPTDTLRLAAGQLWSGRRLAILASAAAFLFLWNFNPFSSNVQQEYLTKVLGMNEQFYGHLVSIQSAAETVACFAYFWYCRRVPLGRLIHLSILAGIVSTVCYLWVSGPISAVLASIVFGLAYQTGLLIQLDLAARICPTESAGTMFALLMALSNTGVSLAIYFGGEWYDALAAHYHGNRHLAFDVLVLIGAAFTAGCWALVPVMKWAGAWE